MLEFKRILSPVDFSETSTHAFDYAVALAERLGAELQVLHVYQMPAYLMPEGIYEIPVDIDTGLVEKLRTQLNTFVDRRVADKVRTTKTVAEGVPYIEIVRQANELKADLVVIGTHGRTGVAHLLMGSVAERVVRTCDVPVMTIRLPEKR